MSDMAYALPATPRQIAYARKLALRNKTFLPDQIQQDRHALSVWIDRQARLVPADMLDPRPTGRQIAFAEKLARLKRRTVPVECFRDRGLMARWIDGNK